MFSNQTAQELQHLLDLPTFIGVVVARAINATTKVKTSDFDKANAYTKRVIKRIDRALACGEEEAAEYLRLTMGINDYECRKSLQYLGGCVPTTLHQALKEATL